MIMAISRIMRTTRSKVTNRAREVMPECTYEDILNPDGIEPLRRDPVFNYEDGILAGLITAQIALRARVFGRGAADETLPQIHD